MIFLMCLKFTLNYTLLIYRISVLTSALPRKSC